MKNNILGGLVIFFVVLTCLLMIDDISNPQNQPENYNTVTVDESKSDTDLAIVEDEE